MVSGVDFQITNLILVMVSVPVGGRGCRNIHLFSHPEGRYYWFSIYGDYSLWNYVWCDKGRIGRSMGCRVVLTSVNLCIYGKSYHSSGKSKFRYIYIGSSVRKEIQGV